MMGNPLLQLLQMSIPFSSTKGGLESSKGQAKMAMNFGSRLACSDASGFMGHFAIHGKGFLGGVFPRKLLGSVESKLPHHE